MTGHPGFYGTEVATAARAGLLSGRSPQRECGSPAREHSLSLPSHFQIYLNLHSNLFSFHANWALAHSSLISPLPVPSGTEINCLILSETICLRFDKARLEGCNNDLYAVTNNLLSYKHTDGDPGAEIRHVMSRYLVSLLSGKHNVLILTGQHVKRKSHPYIKRP